MNAIAFTHMMKVATGALVVITLLMMATGAYRVPFSFSSFHTTGHTTGAGHDAGHLINKVYVPDPPPLRIIRYHLARGPSGPFLLSG